MNLRKKSFIRVVASWNPDLLIKYIIKTYNWTCTDVTCMQLCVTYIYVSHIQPKRVTQARISDYFSWHVDAKYFLYVRKQNATQIIWMYFYWITYIKDWDSPCLSVQLDSHQAAPQTWPQQESSFQRASSWSPRCQFSKHLCPVVDWSHLEE